MHGLPVSPVEGQVNPSIGTENVHRNDPIGRLSEGEQVN